MPSAVQTLDISPVGRVEGDLDVRVNIQDGVVVDAWTQAELFRGFEVILRDKDPQAGLVVTPRACGICGASHLTCAAWALDTAWQTEVPRNAILARNLGQLVESLQSLPRHHYGLFMIDYTNKNYSKSKFYEEAVKRWSPFTGTNYEIGVTICSLDDPDAVAPADHTFASRQVRWLHLADALPRYATTRSAGDPC